jgi:hypothetical protein
MRAATCLSAVSCLLLLVPTHGFGVDLLFKDDFKRGLSDKWQAIGMKESDCRVRDGGLEIRVQSGKLTAQTPMLKVFLPFTSQDIVFASVRVTTLDEFTQDGEFAGVFLIDENGPEFGAKKERVGGKLVFSPGNYRFDGKPAEEGHPGKHHVAYRAATKEAGPLGIIVHRGTAYFQVGPSADGRYSNLFNSAIRDTKQRGFCLTAAGAPNGASHWVRFEEFRVVKE